MASIISYLENYVESTVGLPSDLARFLNMIKVLDERAAELMEAIKHTTEALCRLEPAAGQRKGSPEEQVGMPQVYEHQLQGRCKLGINRHVLLLLPHKHSCLVHAFIARCHHM